MTTKEILIISSSPPKPFTTYSLLSSPPLPSPSEVFTKRVPILRTGSRAAPIPHNATSSFTSASSLLKAGTLQDLDTIQLFGLGAADNELLGANKLKSFLKTKSREYAADGGDGPEDGKTLMKPRKAATMDDGAVADDPEAKKPRKPRKKKANPEAKNDGVVKEKVPRKSRAKKINNGDHITKEKAPRKSGTKKAEGERQTKLPNAQITKASTSTEKLLHTDLKDQHNTTEAGSMVDSLNYDLIEAVKRRFSWTPPPPDDETTLLTTIDPADSLLRELDSENIASEEKGKSFQDLLGSFGFSKVEGSTTERTISEGGGTRKRKLIELVKTNVPASTTAPMAKAPKKKPRTITEQATSAYAEKEEEAAEPASLLQYFSMETTGRVTNDEFKVPPKPRFKKPVKGGKGTAQAPILLSPQSALKQVGNQSFVFGTSSQLAREESPEFLRDIHAAMQASNEADNDDPLASSSIPFSTKSKVLSAMKRNLWSAAARDVDGHLLDVEMVDLAVSPVATRQVHAATLAKVNLLESRKSDVLPGRHIEEPVEAPIDQKVIESSSKKVGPVEEAIKLELLSSPSSSLKSAISPTKSSTESEVMSSKPSSKAHATKATKSSQAKDLEKPNFAAYTMAQLTKDIASYRFKPIKGRDEMIALLEKCWDAQQKPRALEPLPTNLPVSSSKKAAKAVSQAQPSSQLQSTFPKRPRGRPRKGSSATPSPKRKTKTASLANALSRAKKAQEKADNLDEISDSDVAQTPSPPRRHPSQIRTSPLPLRLSSSASVDSCELSPTSSQLRLFKCITAAIRNAPLATDSSNPNWHEKILLYDPIILEDLTVWLNTGALEKAGWDGEVDPKEVKKWCESKSICCLWKENLRGGSRSRY